MSKELIDAFTSIREEDVIKIVTRLLEDGTDPMEVIEVCKDAVRIIGDRFEAGEVFIPELIMAGEMMARISIELKPRLKTDGEKMSKGKILFGTVKGDIHDIGKDIVVFMLKVNGFEVIDLGVDVPVSTFIEQIRETQAPILGLSGLLSLAFDSMKETIAAIEKVGLREGVKIMIGGGPVDDTVRTYSGADAWGANAMTAVTLANKWIEGKVQ